MKYSVVVRGPNDEFVLAVADGLKQERSKVIARNINILFAGLIEKGVLKTTLTAHSEEREEV